jgi:AraC-like DNA-binding protein
MMKDLEYGPPNAANIARQMGMSLSTLKRRLAEKNLTFRGLRDAVIRELSKRALAETDVNISLVAMQLGYSEVSAFNHAFSRLTGQSPRAYRRQARQAGQTLA